MRTGVEQGGPEGGGGGGGPALSVPAGISAGPASQGQVSPFRGDLQTCTCAFISAEKTPQEAGSPEWQRLGEGGNGREAASAPLSTFWGPPHKSCLRPAPRPGLHVERASPGGTGRRALPQGCEDGIPGAQGGPVTVLVTGALTTRSLAVWARGC